MLTARVSGRCATVLVGAAVFVLACAQRTPVKGKDPMPEGTLPETNASQHPLLQVLKDRKTTRDFATRALDRQVLADLLWAAYGVNRPSEGKRTAPSAHDWQYIDIYVADSAGLHKYDARRPALDRVTTGDIRALTGIQEYAARAPVDLVYVLDERKMDASLPAETRMLLGAATTGAISQNVYLYCAAMRLHTGVRSDIERAALHKAMGLAPEQKILLAQSVGYPTTMASLKSFFHR
jgi:nitroreductase